MNVIGVTIKHGTLECFIDEDYKWQRPAVLGPGRVKDGFESILCEWFHWLC